MTSQDDFGGSWTQRKLAVLKKYLQAYTTIFNSNAPARFYTISYVDAFAGTGSLQRPGPAGFITLFPELKKLDEEFRKGSVRRALEVEPPFHKYVFTERDSAKCQELRDMSDEFPSRSVEIVNNDANEALLQWCRNLDAKRERAVVFLDPFGASVKWEAIMALACTRAVDLWVLFPYSAINRMLVRDRKPPEAWSQRLTAVFGTDEWEAKFYSTTSFQSLLAFNETVQSVHKSADHRVITEFYVQRLKEEFEAVSRPFPLHNSNGSLLFILFFAAANKHSAKTGLKIANDIIGKEMASG
jgi:three-Cys-motif partner protein